MTQYLIQGATLTNIANAIRNKAGITTPLFPENMPSYIDAIKTSSSDTEGIPAYVVAEGKRVASGMISKRGANSLTFVAMADMHEMGDTDNADATLIERYRRANRNACQGAKVIADNINLDFFANLGDLAWGSKTSTITDYVQSIVNARNYMYDVTKSVESFITLGNHDTGTYGFAQNGEYLSQGVCDGLFGTYRYVDFTSKKVRVICLNTAEVEGLVVSGDSGTERITGTQLQWFADSLDLSSKGDASEWGIVILSHHPLDWGSIAPANNCLTAYLNGTTYSTTHNGVSVSKAFSGKNSAKVIANIHGHTHCFNVSNLSGLTVKRIAIPNACFARTNEYGEDGNLTYGDSTSYEKTDGTAQNTAFCLVSIDLNNEVIYADCYGAGIDRVISYGGEVIDTFTVTNNLSNATNSNGTATVTAGASYSGSITANNGYELNTVIVTMGGVDITATAYSNGTISISEVTGDIVITVTTTQIVVPPAYTNLVPTSKDSSGNIYNGKGYKEDYRLSSGGGESALSGAVVSGFIPYNQEIIRSWGSTASTAGTTGNYVMFYDASYNKVFGVDGVADGVTYEALNGKYQMKVDKTGMTASNQALVAQAKYIRCSFGQCLDPTVFTVTLNEEIV